MDGWFDDPDAPQRLLIAAPAGRGKSAFLVRWSQRLSARPDVRVAFIPVSVRFRTNLATVVFASLSARLAAIHGDPVPGSPDLPAEPWRGILTDYLSRPVPPGLRLVVIIDGLDEAADWEPSADLFPLALPPGVRIVTSARYLAGDADPSDWLRRLGWDRRGLARSLELGMLNSAELADVLVNMGLPLDRLAANVDVVSELHRLSEGDPLLVRLYVDDIWNLGESAARLQPGDLCGLSPGLEGFLDRWWDDQRRLWGADRPLQERAVQTLLDLMACALGPLSREDILDHLTQEDEGVNAWSLEDALRPLQRFVVGDGRQQGYSFSHPRLGHYFNERLTLGERRKIEVRYRGWAASTLTALKHGDLAPARVSPYLVQYLSAHLLHADADADAFNALVSDGWRQAWFHLEGSYSGFLGDLNLTWSRLEHADRAALEQMGTPRHVGDALRCALGDASVRSLAKNMSPTLLLTLVERGLWSSSQALAYARQAPARERVAACSGILPHLPEAVRPEVTDELLRTVRSIPAEDERAVALGHLAPALDAHDQLAALDIVAGIADAGFRTSALALLVPHLEPQHVPNALRIARSIKDRDFQVQALAAIMTLASARTRGDLLREVLENAARIGDDLRRLSVLRQFSDILPPALWPQARYAVAATAEGSLRGELMAHLLPQFAASHTEEVLAEIRTLPGAGGRARALVACLSRLPPRLQGAAVEEAVRLVDRMQAPLWKAQVLAELADCVDCGRGAAMADDAVALLQQVGALGRTVNETRVVDTIATLAARPDPGLRERLLELSQTELLEQPSSRASALSALAGHLEGPLLEAALSAAGDFVPVPQALAVALSGLVPHLGDELRERAFQMVDRAGDLAWRRRTLGELAPYQDDTRLRRTLASARAIDDGQALAIARATIAAVLEGEVALGGLDEAGTVEDPGLRARLIGALGPAMAGDRIDRLHDGIAAIRDPGARADALSILASRLEPRALRDMSSVFASIPPYHGRERVLAALAARSDKTELLGFTDALTDPDERADAVRMLQQTRSMHLLTNVLSSIWSAGLDPVATALFLQAARPLTGTEAHEAVAAACASVPEHIRHDEQGDVYDPWGHKREPLTAVAALLVVVMPHVRLGSLPDPLLQELLLWLRYVRMDAAETLLPGVPGRVPSVAGVGPGSPPGLSATNALLGALSEHQLKAGLEVVDQSWRDESRLLGMLHIASRLPADEGGAVLARVLSSAREWRDEGFAAALMLSATRMIHHHGGVRRALLEETVERARRVNDALVRVRVLTGLAQALTAPSSADLLAEAAAAARGAALPQRRSLALLCVADCTTGVERESLLEEALDAALAVRTEGRRAAAVAELLSFLPERLLQRVLGELGRFAGPDGMAVVLCGFCQAARSPSHSQLLRILPDALDEESAVGVLESLAPALSISLVAEATAIAAEIEDPTLRARALGVLAPRLLDLPRETLFNDWCRLLRRLASREREDLLSDLCALDRVILHLGGEAGLKTSWTAIDEVRRWWP